MKNKTTFAMACLLAATSMGFTALSSAAPKTVPPTPLTEAGNTLEKKYTDMLKAGQSEISKILPKIDERKMADHQKASEALKKAKLDADAALKGMEVVTSAKGMLQHRQGWVSKAAKNCAAAEVKIKKAATDAERKAAQEELAKAKADGELGASELVKAQAAMDKAKIEEPKLTKANLAAQQALADAQAADLKAANAQLADLTPLLANEKIDSVLVKCAVLAMATPHGLAEFAQQGAAQQALVDKLLADNALMMQMLEAGGAKFSKFGRAMEIYTAIQQTSAKSREGNLQRLALATSLEHAKPIDQSNAQDQTNAPTTIDPVKRYLHYEKAFLDGELDPAFKNFTTWEYRMVVDCDAPDEILAWGREMLRNYRPDHIYTPDYGWRYSSTVRTEVPYGSQNLQYDMPSLQQYQNILLNGGICGRRAFVGRFMLQSFGIPTWGVTQHAHAALSHWTPKGWLVNLGAGFNFSWWDKDEAPRSGNDFLLESQARVVPKDYLKAQRAQWISAVLGEQQYNDRKSIAGGFWSSISHYMTVALASKAVALGPLGQELGEANETKSNDKVELAKLTDADQKIVVNQDGSITMPAVAHTMPKGSCVTMKSYLGGLQMHCLGGFKAQYQLSAVKAGKYTLSARVVTAQKGQKFLIQANDAKTPTEIAVPYTIGKWQQTTPVEITLDNGKNVINFALADGSRGVSIKDFTLTPVR